VRVRSYGSPTEGFGGPLTDVQLTTHGRLCVDYLSADPAFTAKGLVRGRVLDQRRSRNSGLKSRISGLRSQ
jgi:hypothetical protein